MFKNKKFIAFMLCMLIFAQGSIALAASFSDLSKDPAVSTSHWAYDYIMELADKGVINGYPDGTYKPDNNVSFIETLKLLVGVMNPSQTEKTAALEKHSALVKSVGTPTWAEEIVAVSLERGVITETNLREAHVNGMVKDNTEVYISRLSVAQLMARALELESKAATELTYNDLDSIPAGDRPYIAALIETGALNAGGRDGSFLPNSTIKRSEMSKMIWYAYKWAEKNPLTGGVTKTEKGTVVLYMDSNNKDFLTYKPDNSSQTTSVILNSNTKITDKDGKTVAIKDLNNYKNASVTVEYTGEHPNKIAKTIKFTSSGVPVATNGEYTFVSAKTTGGKTYITVKDSKGVSTEFESKYDYANDGNKTIKFNILSSGTKLNLKFTDNIVTDANLKAASSGEYKVEYVDITRSEISVSPSKGGRIEIFKIDRDTKIERANGVRIDLRDISKGDTIDITKKYNSASDILDKIVVHTNNYLSGSYTVDAKSSDTLYVTHNRTKVENKFTFATSFLFDGKREYSATNIRLYRGDQVELSFDNNGRISEVKTTSYSYKELGYKYRATINKDIDNGFLVTNSEEPSIRPERITSYSNVNIYIDGYKDSYRNLEKLLTEGKPYDVQVTYDRDKNVDSIYFERARDYDRPYRTKAKIQEIRYGVSKIGIDLEIDGKPDTRYRPETYDADINDYTKTFKEGETVFVEYNRYGTIIDIRR